MLSIRATIEGNQAVIDGLAGFAKSAPAAVRRGLVRAGVGVMGEADLLLSGAGARGTMSGAAYSDLKTRKIKIKGYKWKEKPKMHSFEGARPSLAGAGAYPVPRRTGWLESELAMLEPGESKKGEAGTFTAADNEVIVYDSAAYAYLIRDGKGSSSKYGPRDFTGDGLRNYDQKVGVATPIEEELQKEIDRL